MFPTLSSLSEYLFGIATPFPMPTFGFFVALAFILSYIVFRSEFKRKEQEGVIKAFEKEVVIGSGATLFDYLEYGFLGFLLGFKVIGAFLHQRLFLSSPLKYMLSTQGNLVFALLCCGIFCYLIYWQKKQEQLEVPIRKKTLVSPYKLMPRLIIWAAIWGFLGAKIFNFFEHLSLYSSYSLNDFLRYSGLTFLGGLVFGAISYLYIGYRKGMRLIDLADIGSPGMLVAYGVGRIGCQLSGDGDWGIVNYAHKPVRWLPDWMWSYRFPHNVLNAGDYIKGCDGNYCSILPEGVYPTSLYEATIILACFAFIWLNRRRIKLPGIVFCAYLIIIGFERYLMEEIKLNHRYDIFGLALSQAQVISILFVVLAVIIATFAIKNRGKAATSNTH